MPEEDQNDQNDGDDDLKDRGVHVADRVMNELRAIINWHDLYAFRKRGCYIAYLLFYPVDHGQSVLTAPHDNDPGNNFALAIQIRYTTP